MGEKEVIGGSREGGPGLKEAVKSKPLGKQGGPETGTRMRGTVREGTREEASRTLVG